MPDDPEPGDQSNWQPMKVPRRPPGWWVLAVAQCFVGAILCIWLFAGVMADIELPKIVEVEKKVEVPVAVAEPSAESESVVGRFQLSCDDNRCVVCSVNPQDRKFLCWQFRSSTLSPLP